MKSPAVLWYPSDFMSSTSFWTNEQCGAYIRLLNYQFILGHLKLDQMKTITNDEEVLSKFIKDKKGLYYNERMEIEIQKRTKYVESRGKNKLGKTKDKKIISKSYDYHMGNGNININSNIYYNNIELNNIFIEYLKIRKKLKAVNSDLAIKLLMNKLEPFDDNTKIKMIENSIQNSWKSVFEVKDNKKTRKDNVPEWFDKDIKQEHLSDQELKEMEMMMSDFKKK